MSSTDVRFNNYHIIVRGSEKWSIDWAKFPGIPYALQFEYNFRYTGDDDHQWFRDKWHYSVYLSIIYVIVIILLQKWMKNRKPYNLRGYLAIWSASLAVFSMIGTIRCLPEFIDVLAKEGFTASFCDSSYYKVS